MFAEMLEKSLLWEVNLPSVGIVTTCLVKAYLLRSHLARCKEPAVTGSQLLLQVKKSFKLIRVPSLHVFY